MAAAEMGSLVRAIWDEAGVLGSPEPPLTGGRRATSSPSVRGCVAGAYSRLTATATEDQTPAGSG